MKLDLLNNLTIKIVLNITKNIYISKLARKTGSTYAYTTKIVNTLEHHNIISKEKTGRVTKITLTNKGIKIQENLNNIKRLL